jgi:hypothetical protein
MSKTFGVISDIRDKIGPLYKKLNMAKFNQEKDDLNKQIETTKKDLEKAKKEALAEIVKAYELFCLYFVGEAHTQWDKDIQEMHTKDPWVAVNRTAHKGPHTKTWASFLDCIELHKLTIFSCDAAELQWYYMQQYIKKPQRFSMTTWLIYLQSRTAPWLLKTPRKVIRHSTRLI